MNAAGFSAVLILGRKGMRMKKNAFTLIELLIVVAIIGVLAAIAVPNFLNAQMRAKIARNQADMKSLATAIMNLHVDKGMYPVDYWDDDTALGCERLEKFFNKVGMGPDCETRSNWAVLAVLTSPIPYMAALPEDPFFEGIGGERTTYLYGDYESAYRGVSGTDEYNHNINALKPGIAEKLGLRPLALDEFALVGSGPDKTFGIGAGASDPVRAVPFDASNGLKSVGDIVVRSGGG